MADHQEERSYIAFISYRHKELDREAAIALQKKIEHFKVPKEFRDKTGSDRLGYCFRDEDELPTSSSLSDSIRYALDHTQFLIVICTPDLPKSEWCAEEIRYFLSTHDRDHLLAVLVNGEPEESFSPYMTNVYDDNGEVLKRIEPLAANITGTPEHYSRPKFKKESIRIVAALIGCPFDELWQRERRYQNRRKVIAGTAAFAAMAVFAIVVGSKNLQIRAQNAEISEQNRQITEQNTQIKDQNTEITEKNKELQVREGKLLAEAGQLLLDGHDLSGAAENAKQALSIEDVHTEGTELLLSNALGAYSAEDLRLDVLVDQNTPVERCTRLTDGSMVFTSDRYGMVRAYRDREEIWSFSAVPSKNRMEYLDDGRITELYLVENETILLVGNAYYIAGLSPKTGAVIWEVRKKYAVNFLAVSPDGSKFAVFNDFAEDCISIHSSGNGTTLTWSYLPKLYYKYKGRQLAYFYDFADYSLGQSYGGNFSPDGKYFMFGVQIPASIIDYLAENPHADAYDLWYTDSQIQTTMERFQGKKEDGSVSDTNLEKREDMMTYSVMDTEEGSVRMFGMEPVESGMNPVFGCSYDPETEKLFFARHDNLARSTYAGVIDSEGNIDYSLQISNLHMNRNTMPRQYLEGNKRIAVSSANYLYIFNKEDNSYLGHYELECNVIACSWINKEKDVLMAVMEDSSYHIYPLTLNGNDLFTGITRSFSMNSLTHACTVGDGIFGWNTQTDDLENRNGSWLLLSSDDPEKVMEAEIFTDPNILKIRPEEPFLNASYCISSPSGSAFYIIEQSGDDLTIYRVDAETGELTEESFFKGIKFLLGRSLGILSNGEKVVYANAVYSEKGSPVYMDSTDEVYFYSLALYSARGQSSDETVYTSFIMRVGKNKEQVVIWKNEEELAVLTATDQDALLISDDSNDIGKPGETVLLKIGENGWTVAGLRRRPENTFSGYLAVSPEGEAVSFEAAAKTRPESLLCPAKETAYFAVLEEDGVIRIYDPKKESAVTEITSPDGFAGAVDLCFAAADQYLGVLSYNGELNVYRTDTGELLLQDTYNGLATEYATTDMQLLLSKDGNKLICIASEIEWRDRTNGTVYDLETRERVAQIPGLTAYSPVSDKLVIFRGVAGDERFYLCPLYDVQDLMGWTE